MPIYEFEDEATGERYDLYFKMDDDALVHIGEVYTAPDGKKLRRLPPTLQEPLAEEDCHHVSVQHPPGWQAHRDAGGKFDRRGRPIMDSWRQVERSVKTANNEYGENVVYDGPTRTIE